MAISYGFFNSVNGDRLYNADDISNYFLKLISNGVFATPSNAMQVQAVSGMSVNVSAGWGFINCKWLNNDAPYTLTLDAADIVLNRIDRIVMRLNADSSHRNMELAIIKGTPDATPTAPALTRVTGGVWELSLAQIYVGANVTEITQANITDERPDTSVCGYVTGLIDQIDTANLFAQYNAAFNEWFNDLQTTLATKTMILRYTSSYTTTTDNVASVPIQISQYTHGTDVLNVYVNGIRLTPGTDYTAGNTIITLSQPLDVVGTVVDFEVLKSVDGTGAESVLNILYELRDEMQKIGANNYYCNGINDNVGLYNWISAHPDADIVNIIGTFGVGTPYTVDGTSYSVVCQNTNGITLDFTQCGTIMAQAVNFGYFSGCEVKGLNVHYDNETIAAALTAITAVNASLDDCRVSGTLAGAYAVTAYNATGSRLNHCDAVLTGAAEICGIQADSSVITCSDITVTSTSSTESAYGVQITDASRCDNSTFKAVTASTVTAGAGCGGIGGGNYLNCLFTGFGGAIGNGFYLGDGQFLSANNCIFRGYTQNTASGSGLGITGTNNSANTIILTSINCNQVNETGYSQTGTLSLSGGYGSYMGCFYTAASVPSTIVSYGSFIRNRV